MIKQLGILQLKLTWRELHSSRLTLIVSLLMYLGIVGGVLRASIALADLSDASTASLAAITVAAFGLLTFLWPVSMVFVMGSNEILDPGRFALYPISGRKLLPGLLAAGFLGMGGLCMTILWVGYQIAWSSGSVAVSATALLGYALGFTLCVLSGRTLSALLTKVFAKRKARDVGMVGLMLFIIGLSFLVQMLPMTMGDGEGDIGVSISIESLASGLGGIAAVMSWTPFGWPWAVPAAAAAGNWGLAALFALGTLALLWGLAWVWRREIERGLVSPLEVGGTGERIKGTGWYDRFFPAGPVGSIAKRSMRYWRRDPRRLMGLMSMLLVPVISTVSVLVGINQAGESIDDPVVSIVVSYLPVLFAFMAATATMWDISYDGSALGTQIVAGVDGVTDRRGRAWAALAIFVPLQLVYLLGVFIYFGVWEQFPNVFGLSVAILLGGVGIGSWAGGYWQAAQRPAGQLTFGKSSMVGGGATFLGALVGLLAPLVIVIPTVVCVVFSFWHPWLAAVALLVGVGSGALVLHLGIVLGGRHLDATWPEVLERVTWKG
ncbi:MAG: hypothetical protein LBC29_04405 [Propionibacteriaceae bacterium]|jgi:ABC-2 type transport system permease protein|nr:hypothetical protein [Propionibacteriaceae bacterium]